MKVPAGMSVDALLETLYALFGTAVNAAYQDEEVSMRAHTHVDADDRAPWKRVLTCLASCCLVGTRSCRET